ncbi:glucosylceramide transporter ABCA12 [Labrus bergylta]|uniref:glucosylceramide transporter ABCA12 n=1 Tax=Labrus bergylta TaxID=56723 RepID=UPI003313CB21
MSLWAMFENASAENVPMIIGKMGKFLGMLWSIIMGGPASHVTVSSLEGFAQLAPILEQVITGTADQVTWDKLENILEALLSLLEGTELWESVSSVVPLFEKIVGSLVNNLHAENVMILSLQKPMVTLMKEIAQSVNSSHFNLTEVTERMQVAIEHTVQAAQQANNTLECSDVLKAWDPVREAAGHAKMAVWCNLNLRPVLEAYMEAQVVYSNLNMSHMNMGPMTVDTTAERIAETLQSVYQVSLNRTHVAQTLIMTFSNHLSMLTGQPLSPEAQLHWQKQLQDLQLLNSLSSLKMLTDQLLMVAPSLQPFIEALEKALHHILDNYHQIQDSSSSEDIFKEAVMIFLNNSNITSEDISSMMLGNFSEIDVASLTDMMRQAVKFLMEMFEDVPVVYQGLEHFLASNDTDLLVQKVAEMVAWLASTEEYGLDMLNEALAEIFHILRPLLSSLTNMSMDMPAHMGLFEDLADNIVAMVRQIVTTGGLLGPKNFHHGKFQQDMTGLNHTNGVRRKRDAQWMPVRSPMDDFIDLFYIDYHAMFKALSVPPTTEDILETVHVFFANPDVGVVIKGVTSDMSWNLNVSQENTIDATMGMLSFFTLPGMFETSSMELLQNSADMIPDHFPFATMLQKISKALASESPENLLLMENTFKIASELLQIDLTDSRFIEKLDNLTAQVCSVEKTETVRMLMSTLAIEPGQLCYTLMPVLQIVAKSLMMNSTSLSEALFEAVIGDPSAYDVNFNWTSVLSEGLNFNTSSLNSLNINIKPLEEATVGEMMRNEAAFVEDVQQYMDFDPAALQLLMNTTLPNSYLMILSWLINLRHCNSKSFATLDEADVKLIEMFCSMPVDQWYSFSLLIARHVNMEKLIYRMVLSDEMQGLVGVMLQMAEIVMSMMDKILPAVGQLESYLRSIEDLNLKENEEFHEMTRGLRSSRSTKATFVTLSRALCSNGILALFGLSQLQLTSDLSNPSSQEDQKREEMIERFKLPRNASPFCMSMYLDMVNTTGGAIAWAFLKPMLMGQILFTPDTPVTRDIMEKSNATLQELADLRKYSGEWIESSKFIIKSAQILSHTLPMLQNSLGNSFVKNFIEMQTDINVGKMKETLSNFSNMTLMLEKNKHMLKQITTLSTLMVNLSSCVKFDRYRGYNSVEELNADGQELAKNRDLYASVIFKLPKDSNSSRKRREASFTSSLPPKVSYTIRMHMDNVMRTDRVRNPYFTKQTHISARQTLRYNRGFVYLQENIDRAIIATQTGQTVAEPAVQLQPFPYPCHLRDEYLEAISFVFPLMLMIAWLLFVADFVKKLVHERELRLHEYMKMMGVNPLSHFFAWFLECATYLVLTIFILTLVLKYGSILPHSDGFLLFLYLCDYGLSILAFSYLVSSFFDKTFIAGLSGSLLYILCFFPFIVVMAVETTLTLTQKSILSLFSPTCFSYASQYISRYESQGEGIHWSNSYSSPIAGDTASFGWLCWLMLIDSLLYFFIGAYIRTVFPGKYGIPSPWYFPFKASFWAELCGCVKSNNKARRGLLFTNIMQEKQPVFSDDKGKGQSTLYSQAAEDHSDLPVGVALHGLSKMYGDRVAIQDLNVSFYEGHVTTLLGHNGAGKTTTMSLLTGLFAPTSGTIEVYGRDMQNNIDEVRRELGVCMQYDVLFDHMTTKEHLLLYGQIKAPHWSKGELHEQVRTILEETGMYAHRHKRVGTLSGGMKRKLSISIAFIGGSRLVVLDEPTTGVDPCSRRSIWDIVIQHKKQRTIIMSTHHLDEAEVLSDRITFLERGGLKCVGSPFHLKDKLGQGYKLTLTKKMQNLESEQIDNVELKSFIQAHVPEARLKEAQGGDLVYSLPAFNSSNASSYRSLLTALDSNLDALQLGGYGISDTTLEEVFLQLGHENTELGDEDCLPTISETVSDTVSMDSFTSDLGGSTSSFSDNIKLTGSTMARGMTLACQQMAAMLTKRFHHSRRDWKGLICQILLPVLFMVAAMGLGSIKSDLQHYPELELSPALYKFGPSYSFFSNSDPNSEQLISTMMSFPGIDNACLNKPNNPVCSRSTDPWRSSGNSSKAFSGCKCTRQEQTCDSESYQPPHKRTPSSQIVYNLSGINVEEYLVTTANDFIRNRYGGFALGMPLPADLQMDVKSVPKNRTLSKVWFNPEGHHTMPAYLNSINNFILRSNLPADKDPRKYAISVSSHPYFGRADDEDAIVQGMLQILVAMCVLTGYSITTASFAIYVVNEHHSGSKRLQHIAGISEPFYWAVNFFFDMVVYLIPVTLTVAVIAAFQIPAFTDRQNLAAITVLLVLFGFATFPWMYLLSGVFKDAEMAFITFVCINLFISVNTVLSTSILFFLSQISTIKAEVVLAIFNRLCNAFLIFPQFNFGHGMMQLARKNIEVQILSGYGIDAYQNPFSMDAMAWLFISSFIQGVVLFSLRLLLNRFIIRKVRHLICGRKTVSHVAPEDEDQDVTTEHQRVASGAASSDILQVNHLTKIYQNFSKKVQAVKGVSVGIPAGECFGLLGENGAGKTTTFKMLTGDVSPTDGTAQIRDRDGRLVDIMECRHQGINIGYCPQVDALDNLLTGEEHLYFYARIRGISKREIDGVVRYLLKRLELNYHRNITTEGYSCGTRRKLSTALALIGHPQILLLDEPSSGMDPRTKRHLWKIISEEVKGKCAVVLTSHSMEECEALCGRLAIMVKGQFRCLGSLQHIKNRFGSGFTVKMYLAEASCNAEAITGFMQRRFPSTYLKDQHSNMAEYHVPVAVGGVADIFDQLESNKNDLQIKHFSVSQTTLDEVFINFAMEKSDMENIPIDDEGDSDRDSLGSIKAVES